MPSRSDSNSEPRSQFRTIQEFRRTRTIALSFITYRAFNCICPDNSRGAHTITALSLSTNQRFRHEGDGAVYQGAGGSEIVHPLGWTSHEHAFDNAASSLSETGGEVAYELLSDPTGAPVDMSFTLFASPEP
jgi:hypothetical protein